MAPSLSTSSIILALSLWTGTNLLPVPPPPPPPTTPSSLPLDVNQTPQLQNASKERYNEYDASNKPVSDVFNISEELSDNVSFSLDIPVIKTPLPLINPDGDNLSSTLPVFTEDKENVSSVVYGNMLNPDLDTPEVDFKPLCDEDKHSCKTESRDSSFGESDTKSDTSVSNSSTVFSEDSREIITINMSETNHSDSDVRRPDQNFTEYVHPTSASSSADILHKTRVTNQTRPPTPFSALFNTTATQTTPTTLLTTTFETTSTSSTETAPMTSSSTRKSVSRSPEVKGQAAEVNGQTKGGKKAGGKKKGGSVSSVPTHHLAKHFTGFVQHVWLPNSTPRPPGPIDDGPFGSILWRDKKYLVSVLIPIGVGFAGAMMIIVMAYASRAWRKRKERLAHAQGLPGSFLEAATSKNDDTAPLHESSDDEF